MFCSNCGSEVTGKFCANCGTPVGQAPAPDEVKQTEDVSIKFRATKKCGSIEIDEINRLLRVKNASSEVFKQKNGALGKAALAMATGGISLAVSAVSSAVGAISKIGKVKGFYNFSDLINFELLEDDTSITSGGVGQALVGGAVFGGFGAVAGGITGTRKTKKVIEHLVVKITVNDFEMPCIMIPLINKTTKTSSKDYQEAFEEAHKIISLLNVIAINAG